MMVSQKDIIEALRAYDKAMAECGYELAVDKTIADRIESEGIAPPDGWVLVPSSRKLSDAPCDVCGYKGPGYYQPDTHPCAASPRSVR